jgi:hypothetical protein
MKKGEFDDVFRYELDDENWRPTYILYKLTSIKLAKCKIISSSMFLFFCEKVVLCFIISKSKIQFSLHQYKR